MIYIIEYLIFHVILSAAMLAMMFAYAWYHDLSWRMEGKTIALILIVCIVFPVFPVIAGFYRMVKDFRKHLKDAKEQKK